MPTNAMISGPEAHALASNALSRKPRQGRSLASFERMLAATRRLILERGNEDFTLHDVSELGDVSIGSIYLRFESKDRLLHAVLAEEMRRLLNDERQMLDTLCTQCPTLGEFLPLYIDRYSLLRQQSAGFLRTIIQRATIDPLVSGPARETRLTSTRMSVKAIMHFAAEIRGAEPLEKARTASHIVFAAISREFGIGSSPKTGDEQEWAILRRELSSMVLTYLRADD